jgi:heavy metal sensor kinase
MVNTRSLRFRLAAWYFCTVAAIFALAAGGYWLTVRSALNSALDQHLRFRVIGLGEYLQNVDAHGQREIASRLDQINHLGELYQVFDGDGNLIAQSYNLARRSVPGRPPRDLGSEIRYETGGPPDFPLRLAWQKVAIAGQPFIVGAADPQRKYDGVLGAFTSVLLLSTPVILTLATVCGLWLGRRALRPIARITEDARAITEQNLSARLAVADSRDELQQLSETLNAMLGRIEESFSRIKQFTADASHELRAPMTLIYAAAQYSLRRERSRDELLASMQKIQRESQRTTALIDDLLRLARGDDRKETVPLLPMATEPLLRDVAEQARTMAADKNIDVQLHVDADPLHVRANEASLRRLLLVLVDNAVKFTPRGGTVILKGSRDATHVTISVADTGAGIAPDDQRHIFERFWRADKVRAREAGGTGLGLPIARQIAEQHGAGLSVKSEVGGGSLFALRLPANLEPTDARVFTSLSGLG